MNTDPSTAEQPVEAEPSRAWLDDRVREWQDAEIITAEQASAIVALEAGRQKSATNAYRYGRLIGLISAFGAILLGVGLILLVAANWADLPRITKVAIAILVVVALESVGFWLRYHTEYVRTGGAFLFVGAAAYGGAIALVGQTYNYPTDDPNLLVVWFLPVLPLAYIVRSQMVAALAIVVGYWAIGIRAAEWLDFFDDDRVLFVWQTLYLALAAGVVAIGYLHERWENVRLLGRPYEWIGSTTILVLLYIMGFEFWYDDPEPWLAVIPTQVWILLAAGLALMAAASVRLAQSRQDAGPVESVGGILVPGIAAYLLIGLMMVAPAVSSGVMFVLENLLTLVTLVGLVAVGVATRREALVNVSVLVFGIVVFTRYLAIGFGMFGTSLALIVGGLLLIAMAWALERLRRDLIARIEQGSET